MPQLSFSTSIGWLGVVEADGAIVQIGWRRLPEQSPSPLVSEARRQIEAYLVGELRDFDLPVNASGSDFERQVWQAMLAIPYGKTRSYGDIAFDLGAVARAVGQACGSNPVPIVIPCHRVLAADGLGGFSRGTGRAPKPRPPRPRKPSFRRRPQRGPPCA